MKKIVLILTFSITICIFALSTVSQAQPYGKGKYGSNVPYGNETSLSISTDGNVTISVTPTIEGTSASGTSNVTVSSTDVTGYKLYIRALDTTNMNNLGASLPASTNETPGSLAVNTWGYNTDASSNFIGITLNDTLIRSTTEPALSDATTITYGMKLDMTKPAGNYIASVIYTAVPQTD